MNSTRRRTVVPARDARAVRLAAGDRVRVVDLEGRQVGDVFCFAAEDPSEALSAAHTRTQLGRLFPALWESFVTDRRRPILTLVDDTSPGVHDMLIAACDPARYQALGVEGRHASCAENLHRALGEVGLRTAVVPQPVNVFMRISIEEDGGLTWLPALSLPGDSVTFEAAMDCVLVVSACPQDVVGINGGNEPTALALDLLPAHEPAERVPALHDTGDEQ
ncbi:urea carboxylase-associated family protein [Actinoallomurus liliacearum]|uniref:urea carboxylase-associated family protein n=1 Tax=Actinoallomurus liliacearum TaxID=1080073 RepID=UPI0031E8B9EB